MLPRARSLSVQANSDLPTSDTFEQTASAANPTVLLAEDDDELRYITECTLKVMGYSVLACADAHLAALAFRSHGKIDFLLTDFQMPGRTGVELARELTSLSPSLPVMIVTGSVLSAGTMDEIAQRGWNYMAKPFNIVELQKTLNGLTNTRRVAA